MRALRSPLVALLALSAPLAAQYDSLELVWQELQGAPVSWNEDGARCATAGERAFLAANSGPDLEQPERVLVEARQLSDGAALWGVELDSAAHESVSAIAADEQALYLATATYLIQPKFTDLVLRRLDASSGAVLWEEVWDTGGGEWAHELALSPDGQRLYLCGQQNVSGFSSGADVLVQARDAASGAVLWSLTHDGTSGKTDFPVGMLLSPDGARLHLLANSHGSKTNEPDFLTLTYRASDGLELWSERHEPLGVFTSAEPRCLALDPTGSTLVVAGKTSSLENVVAYDALQGSLLWESWIWWADVRAITCDANGALYVTGQAVSPEGKQVASARLDLGTGLIQWWTKQPGDPAASFWENQTGVDLVVDPAGLLLRELVVHDSAPGDTDMQLLVRSALTGAILFETELSGDELDTAQDLALADDGSLLLSGRMDQGAHSDGRLVRVDPSGTQILWTEDLDRMAGGGEEAVFAAQAPEAERLFLASWLVQEELERTQLTALDSAQGTPLWSLDLSPSDPLASSRPDALTCSADGSRIYLAWEDSGSWKVDARAGADGSLLWSQQPVLGGLPVASVNALRLSPDEDALYVDGANPISSRRVVARLDPHSGAQQWVQALDQISAFDSPLPRIGASADRVITFSRDFGNFLVLRVVGLRASDGALMWEWTIDSGSPGYQLTQPRLALSPQADKVYLGYVHEVFVHALSGPWSEWRMHALAVEDGSPLGFTSITPPSNLDILHDPILSVRPSDGALALGAELSTLALPERLFFAAWSSELGAPLWSASTQLDTDAYLRGMALTSDGQELVAQMIERESGFTPTLKRSWSARARSMDTGAETWDSELQSAGFEVEPLAMHGPDAQGRLVLLVESQAGLEGAALRPRDFRGSPASLSTSAGGTQALTLRAGLEHGGKPYLILGSLSGTSPATSLGSGLELPLVPDAYTALSLAQPGAAPLVGNLGSLDALGGAQASFVLPSGASASLIGLPLAHAYVVLGAFGFDWASQAVALELLP